MAADDRRVERLEQVLDELRSAAGEHTRERDREIEALRHEVRATKAALDLALEQRTAAQEKALAVLLAEARGAARLWGLISGAVGTLGTAIGIAGMVLR